jgi:hypothetical protein
LLSSYRFKLKPGLIKLNVNLSTIVSLLRSAVPKVLKFGIFIAVDTTF